MSFHLKVSVIFALSVFLTYVSVKAQLIASQKCSVINYEETTLFETWMTKQLKAARTKKHKVRIPVVVHILHSGEAIGEGFNFSTERIEAQIRTLNEDFERKEGTPGFNSHEDGASAAIEFVLAKVDPDGNPTDGIVRINTSEVPVTPINGNIVLSCSQYSYWNPDQYLNIWCRDLGIPPGFFLGEARFPVSDLAGLPDRFPDGDADGVFVNALNFGQGETHTDPVYNMGRTLTHEVGHFLGLLHTFGPTSQGCSYSDFCEDTPPISSPSTRCPSPVPLACDGRRTMIENYMDLSDDACMNIFTRNQIARMHIVLENSPRRKSLPTSPALSDPVTGIADGSIRGVNIYPNPAHDAVFVFINGETHNNVTVSLHTLLGKIIWRDTFSINGSEIAIPLSGITENRVIITVEATKWKDRKILYVE